MSQQVIRKQTAENQRIALHHADNSMAKPLSNPRRRHHDPIRVGYDPSAP